MRNKSKTVVGISETLKKVLLFPTLQKFYLAYTLLLFLLSNSAIGSGPGDEEWKDGYGNRAPMQVRQAIDKLWDAEEVERAAHRHVHAVSGPSSQVILINTLWELLPIFLHPEKLNPLAEFDAAQHVWVSRVVEMKTALFNFQRTVREHVRGRFWFGDIATDDNHDEWIPDQEWQVQFPSPDQNGNRDMNIIPPVTLRFVNAWGGWASEHIS